MGAKFRCPDCGFSALLRTHDMKPSGEVVPSIVCPIEGCDFHEFVILEGYADAA